MKERRLDRAALIQLLGLLAAGGVSGTAHAQIAETPLLEQLIPSTSPGGGTAFQPGVSAVTRLRPEYDSPGVQLGNFVIRPEVAESTGYETNVLGTPRPHGSALLESTASISAGADWSRTRVSTLISVDDNRYLNEPVQSFTNWLASVGGSYDVGLDTVSATYSHVVLSQTPGGLDVPQIQSPIQYSIDTGQVAYRYNLSSAFITPALQVSSYSFGSSTVAGATYQQNYRDRVVLAPSVTAGYELSPRRNVVVVFRDSNATYDRAVAGLPRRNYNDAALLGGFDYDADGVIRYRLLAGYEVRTFSSSTYKTIAAPIVEASAIWTPTGLTTVTGTAGRRIQDSSDETTSGFTENYVQLRVDHEYLPNVLLRANTGVFLTNYQGGGSQRFYTAGAGATYLLNRNMQAVASYDFSARDSGSTIGTFSTFGQTLGSSYTDHRILLQLHLRL